VSKIRRTLFGVIAIFLIFICYSLYASQTPNLNNDVVGADYEISTDYQFKTNRYTQQETDNRIANNEFIAMANFRYLGENTTSNLALYVDETDLSFVVADLTTNYLWSSKPDLSYLEDPNSALHEADDIGITPFGFRRINSPLVVSYYVGNLKRDEGLFDSLGSSFTYEELSGSKVGFEAKITFATSKIKLKLLVYLDANGLNVEVPVDSIEETSTQKISNLTIYQYFGATKNERIPGYVFVPDGIGALIRFNKRFKGAYNKKYYGTDLGSMQPEMAEQPLFANLYGMVHGIDQNGFISIIERGSAYANLISISAGTEDDFNRTFVSFDYRVIYTQYLNARKTSSVKMLQEHFNNYDIKLVYKFLNNNEANYLGMAKEYKNYLNLNENNTDSEIGLHLNVLAAENRQTLFGKQTFSMTSINQLLTILETLNDRGISNLDVTYHGWANIGFSNSNLRYKNLNKKIGSTNDLAILAESSLANIYFSADYTHTYINAKGYSSKDVLQTISQEYIKIADDKYLIKVDHAYKMLVADYSKFQKYAIENLDFLALSNELASDFAGKGLNREEAIEQLQAFLSIASKSAIRKPFSFFWDADVIYDIPLYSSNQTKFSDTVPFIPLVLENKVAYSRASNFFSNTQNEILRMIDYNIYPSFYLTHNSPNLLLNTKSEHIYTSAFSDWEAEIKDQYNYINDALAAVVGAKLTTRTILDLGFVKNSYDNGVTIYINYSQNHYSDGSTSVAPQSYEVVK
jgi:hypothetical protein